MSEHAGEMIDLPFRFGAGGRVVTTGNPNQQAASRLGTLIDTSPGERVMRANYGTTARELVFENDPNAPHVGISASAHSAVRRYEPDIILRSVDPILSEDGRVDVDVAFSLEAARDLSQGALQATISIGGEVEEYEELSR